MILMGYLKEISRYKMIYVPITALICGFILPIAFFVYLLKKKKINDSEARIKEERTFPYLVGIGLLITGLTLMILQNINSFSIVLWGSYLIMNIIIIIVNRFWKISAHASGVGVALGAFTAVDVNLFLPLLLIVLIVSWTRLELKCHTFAQVTAGALLAALTAFINIKLI